MNKIELLESALSILKEVNKDKHIVDIVGIEQAIDKLKLSEIFGVSPSCVYSRYPHSYVSYKGVDFVVTERPYLTNRATKYSFDGSTQYIKLDNGNIGRLMFNTDASHWNLTQTIWDDFRNELLSYNPVEWDNLNFNYVYTIEDGVKLFKDFDAIYKKYNDRFEEVEKEFKIKKLEEQLKDLKG